MIDLIIGWWTTPVTTGHMMIVVWIMYFCGMYSASGLLKEKNTNDH